jgi:hypothetical protein
MIKAYASLKDGGNLILMGLSEDNINLLKQDKPILFDLESGLSGKVAIVYYSEEFEKYADRIKSTGVLVFVLNDEVVDKLRTGEVWVTDIQHKTNGKCQFVVVLCKTQEELFNKMKPYFNEKTVLKTVGFSPTSRQNFMSMN